MSYSPSDILFDKYRIEALIGQGAFGDVYRVTHLALRVTRAVKILRRDAPGMGSTLYNNAQQRFMLEGQLGARLKNPYLLQIYDFIIREDVLLLEMEYAPGGSLAEKLEKLKADGALLPIPEALRVALEIASGLSALHARDIIHRDLKPSNILFDEQGQAHLADLGLAQIPGGPSMRSQLSDAQPHPGTPGYMSPEQEFERGLLKPPSDVYALGLVLFEMLTGRSYAMLRPGTRANSLRREIPARLDDLLAKMLAKSPDERPWDGNEARELLKSLDGDAAKRAEDERREREAAEKAEQERLEREKRESAKKATEGERREQEKREREKREAEEEGKRRELILDLGDGVTMEFVRVPAGEFLMGSDKSKDPQAQSNEMPQHKIHLDEFLIGKYPVTERQYQVFVKKTGQKAPSHWKNGSLPPGREEHPIVNVNWGDANAFCKWAAQVSGCAVRLPSEAEWEKAARGTDGRIYPWGSQKLDKKLCNFDAGILELFSTKTTPIGKYSPQGDSPYGCADMAGNVWEWVGDWYDGTYYQKSASSNPAGPSSGQVRGLRGGSWLNNGNDLRAAYRLRYDPGVTNNYIGFRCARSSP